MLRRGHLAPPSALLAPPSALLTPPSALLAPPSALFALAVALAACNRQPGADTPAAIVQAASSDPWIVQAVTSVGEHATFVAVVHPERWPAVHARLVTLPLPPELAVHLAAAADPSRWLTVLLDVLRPAASPDDPRAVVPDLDLTGWDRTRPLVLAFADLPLHAPTGLLAATHAPDHHPGMRHEFVIPATDPATLTTSLSRSLAALGPARPGFVAQFPGASAWALGPRDILAVIPGDRLVRIILDVGAVAPDDTATLPDLSPRPAARTTAGVQTLATDAAASLLIRPHRLPALNTALVAAETTATLALAGPAQAALARRAILRSQVACELIWGAEPLEIDDYALALAGDDHGLHLRAVASLTPRGAAALDAGTRFEGMPLALVRPAALDAWIRLDPTAASASTGKPVSPLTTEDVMSADFTCGAMVALFSPTAPFAATTRMQVGVLGDTPLPTNQTAVGQLAVTDVAARRGGVAMLTDPTVPQDQLELPFRNLAELLGAAVKVVAEPEGERQRVRAAYNTGPADVFGGPAPHDGLAHLHADLAALAPLIREWDPAAAAALASYNRLTGSLRRVDNTVVADLDLTTGDPPARGLAVTTAWDPLPAPAQAKCAQDYARGLARLLRPIAVSSETSLDEQARAGGPPSLDQALADLAALEPALTCLASDPTVDVQRLRGRPADALADAFLEQYRHADATRVLSVACTAGVAAACTRNQQLATAIVPTLATVDTTCDDPLPGTRTLAVTTTGRTLDNIPLLDLATLRTLVKPTDRLTLALDRNLTLADLRELLTVVGELGVPLSFVATSPTSRAPQQFPLATPRLAPTTPLASDETTPAHTITLAGDTLLPPDDGPAVALPGPLRVAPDDTSRWQTIAGALARSCDGATLVARTGSSAPKPPALSIGPVKPLSGALDKDVIRRIVRAHINEVRYCYNQALARDPNAKGRVSVTFTIGGDGKVRRAELGESTLPDVTASQCIATAVRRWTFPKPEGGDVNVTYPFVLEPG